MTSEELQLVRLAIDKAMRDTVLKWPSDAKPTLYHLRRATAWPHGRPHRSLHYLEEDSGQR